MNRFVWIGLTLLVLAFLLPGKPSASLRNAAGMELVEAGYESFAKPVYSIGKIYKEPLASNNWAVLNYRRVRALPNLSKAEKRNNRMKALADFEAVGDAGFAAGYYNAAMICFKCGYKTPGYKKAVSQLEQAIALDDALSVDALALISKKDKTIRESTRTKRLEEAAEGGNDVAARYIANKIHDKNTPEYEKYVLIAARVGNADAQAMAADLEGQDRIAWLEQAASNKKNRNTQAGVDVAYLYQDMGNFEDARKWMSIGGKPRDEFVTRIDIRKDGLRWRGQRTTRVGDHGYSYIAASNAAGMKMVGFGGKSDFRSAQQDIDYTLSYKYGHEAEILNVINDYKGGDIPEDLMIRANLRAFEKDFVKHNRTAVKQLLETGDAEYFTSYHFYRWLNNNTENGVPTSENAKQTLKKLVRHCRTQSCFQLTRAAVLPDKMSGGNSVTFIIPEGVPAPKSSRNHNTYIFLGEDPNGMIR